ncbi:MAG: serine/threonine-protein kinase, partial [Vicinamibacterales bacterium]
MLLATGTHLGPYEILGQIGAGGMGEVYRGRDARLNRDAAIKVLPPAFAADPERMARFDREAQVLASLNHPNIAQIYGIEDAPPLRALVMELVEGEDLSDRIRRGPLPIDDAIAIARQIADGLACAHEQGIVHRDLKPANVKLRADGAVKVLDFGLARLVDPVGRSSPSGAQAPTTTSPATQLGVILGTAAYMAPEQARGKVVDKRADVWAFGVVLFEMLAGRRAFEGGDISDTLAFILTRDPDWTALPATTPTSVRRLLRRCLQKDPRQRLADLADARLELDEALLLPEGEQVIAAPVPSRRRVFSTMAAAAIGGALLAVVVAWTLLRPAQRVQTVVRFVI